MAQTGGAADAADIGLIGLGVMGQNLALNIAEKGYRLAVWNRDRAVTERFHAAAGQLAGRIDPQATLEGFVAALRPPRAVILMIPAGAPVDEMLARLRPLLAPGDVVIDAGNAHFRDTERHVEEAAASGLHFMGLGVSGGAEGARWGPSLMAGGPREAWERVREVMLAIAARHEGEPCAAWLGPGGAGHFVKMVHNGIEYADMQLLAEAYGLMRDGLALEAGEIGALLAQWNAGELESYLVEITAEICRTADPVTGRALLDVIDDRVGQKGTGRWTVVEAQHLGVPVPVIDAAVAARNISAQKPLRLEGERRFGRAPRPIPDLRTEDIAPALVAARIIVLDQGFALMAAGSAAFGWQIPLPTVARIWRAGCIIRSRLLEPVAAALPAAPAGRLALDDRLSGLLELRVERLRSVAATALAHGHPAGAMAAALVQFDAMRTGRGTANLLAAQRDRFGGHGFARLDAEGEGFHGPWTRPPGTLLP